MLTDQAIEELAATIVLFRKKFNHTAMTVREALESMSKEELIVEFALLLQAANNVANSKL